MPSNNTGGGIQDSFSLMGGRYGGEPPSLEDSLEMSVSEFQAKESATETTGGGGGKRGVQFRRSSTVEEVMNISRISNYDMSEIISYWGDSEDHILRKAELKQAVQDMYYHRRGSDADFTRLGIDDKVGSGKARKKANRQYARTAVMDEQDLQYHEGHLDDELLADVYSITTYAAQKAAQTKAERLQQECRQHDTLEEQQQQQN